jgi:hypothetical protein
MKKFSLDPECKVMIPVADSNRMWRNVACWEEFWLTDSELDGIVSDVMEDYQQLQQE